MTDMQENRQSHEPSTGSGTGFHSGGGSSASGDQGMTDSGPSAQTRGNQQSGSSSSSSSMGSSHMGGTSTGSKSGNSGDGMSELLDMSSTAQPSERTEGKVARMIEAQTSKLPSDTFLWAAVGAMGASAVCELGGWKSKSRFFGQWVAPLLLFGVYNKMVKQHGHDELH